MRWGVERIGSRQRLTAGRLSPVACRRAGYAILVLPRFSQLQGSRATLILEASPLGPSCMSLNFSPSASAARRPRCGRTAIPCSCIGIRPVQPSSPSQAQHRVPSHQSAYRLVFLSICSWVGSFIRTYLLPPQLEGRRSTPDFNNHHHTCRVAPLTCQDFVDPSPVPQLQHSAFSPLLLVFLILRLDDRRGLDGALLEEAEAFAALARVLAFIRTTLTCAQKLT